MPVRVSDVITNVTKKNMNVMTSTCSVLHVKRWSDVSANQNNIVAKIFVTVLLRKKCILAVDSLSRNKKQVRGVPKSEVKVTSAFETMKITEVIQSEE